MGNLRLVHPQGQAPAKSRRGRGPAASLSLTPDERRFLRVAIKNTARAYGGMAVLATVTGLPVASLRGFAYGVGSGSVALARLIARAGGVSIESILTGALNAAGRCPTCGHRAGDGRTVLAAGGAR